jgi:hypothetical protein
VDKEMLGRGELFWEEFYDSKNEGLELSGQKSKRHVEGAN